MGKRWYTSKTVWVNSLLLLGVFLQEQLGITMTLEEQGAVIAVVNLLLRVVTKEGLEM